MAQELFDEEAGQGGGGIPASTGNGTRGKKAPATPRPQATEAVESASSSTEPGGGAPLMAAPTSLANFAAPVLPDRVLEAQTGGAAANMFAGEGLTVERVFTQEGVDVFDTTEWELRTAAITDERGAVVFEQKDCEIPKSWSMLATNVVVSKYFRGKVGTPGRERSVRQIISRVADTIHKWGKQGGYFATEKDAEAFHDELKYLLLHQYMAFNSPVWFNLGVPGERPQVSACFINSVDDTMESILTLARTEGMLFKWGSGTGTNFSVLRSSQESLKGGGTASGPVSFMRGFDAFAGAIKSGGKTRRAAKMVILNADHPDVEEFIECKADAEKKAHALIEAGYSGAFNVPNGAYDSVYFQNANHSVRATDDFMRAVDLDRDWTTSEVLSGKPAKTIRARDLMKKISEATWVCGDPGMQFDTTINRWHPCPNTSRINASNPCCFVGETLVNTADGLIRFDRLHEMDTLNLPLPVVPSWDKAAKTACLQPINKVWVAGYTADLVDVATEDGAVLRCTPEHRFLTWGGEYVPATELTPGTRLRRLHQFGKSGKNERQADDEPRPFDVVAEVRVVTLPEPVAVYDMEVAETHNFSVVQEMAPGNFAVVVSNSEYMFLDDSACNLASLNLMRFRRQDREFDVELFQHAVRVTITAMEIMVSNAAYPTDKITVNSHDYRPLGLGYANLGALLMARGYPYDSDEGRGYAAAITAIMSGEAYNQSAKMAHRVGPFAGYERNRQPFLRVMKMHRDSVEEIDGKENVPAEMLDAARQSWDETLTNGNEYGFRNAQISVLAPTGTIGFLMDCDTTGVEPDIAIVKYKTLVGGGMFKIVNQTVPEALERLGYSAGERKAILEYIEQNDTIEGAPGFSEEHLPIFDCAFRPKNGDRSIQYMGHIRMMAAVQPFLSGAISKTVNMPHEATAEDIAEAYTQAWKMGVKALAIYRDGSKKTQPLSTGRTSEQEKAGKGVVIEARPFRRKLPDERQSLTHKFSVGGHEGYLTVGLYPDNSPGEIFITMSKEGSVVSGLMDSFATSISLALQYGVPLRTLVEKFMHTRFEPSGFTGNPEIPMAKSIMDYLFRYLALKFLNRDERRHVGLIADQADEYDNGGNLVDSEPAGVGKPGQAGPAGTPAVAANSSSLSGERQVFVTQADAPPCPDCGSITTRNGACYRCANCGTSIGCS